MPSTLPLRANLASLRDRALAWSRARRGELAGAAMVALAGFGVTALAVAPSGPASPRAADAAGQPRRLLTEPLPLPSLAPQLRALAAQPLELSRSTVTRSTDSLDELLARLGVDDGEAAAFLGSDATAARVLLGRSGRMVRASTDGNGRLIELGARYPAEAQARRDTHFSRMLVRRDSTGHWQALADEAEFGTQLRLAAGTVIDSLFAATDAADVPDTVAMQLAEIFSGDIDFHRELKRGDRFVVVYELLSADGEPVAWNEGAGRVLAAEFVNAGRRHQALWFADPAGSSGAARAGAAVKVGTPRGGYYGSDGRSRRRDFLASPLAYSRVSSGYEMRTDPFDQRWRAHLGVDYAAPAGTVVRAVGDGVVEFAGWMGSYGQTVTVAHGDGRVTLHAHLGRIDVQVGEPIEQGQPLGAVGASGWATGPHLHFEFRVMGVHQDPVAMARSTQAPPLVRQARARFAQQRDRSLAHLALAATLVDSSGGTSVANAPAAKATAGSDTAANTPFAKATLASATGAGAR